MLPSVWCSVSMHGKGNNFQWFLCTPTACLLSEDNTIMPIAELRSHLWLASVWCGVSMHGKGNNFQWFLCIPTACLLSEDNTITPIADAYFLSEAAQCQKYTLSDLVDHVDPKHTAAQQVVTPLLPHGGSFKGEGHTLQPIQTQLVCAHVQGGFLFFSDRQCQGSVALTITAFVNLMMACVQIQLF